MTCSISRRAMLAASAAFGFFAVPSFAQMATPPSTENGSDGEIIVTGSRASARAAIKAKRDASVILDAVSQDQVGRLPDFNIVEASRRITGVSVVGGADATKNRDIYQRATIRGLDPRYNLVTIDDIPLASPDWIYRGARLEMLPAALVSRIEAIKTVTAQYDPHALGGQLNIVSKSAFDQNSSRFLVVNAYGGLNDTAGKLISKDRGSVRADATASTVFGSNGQFGIVVAAEYQRLPSTARAELPGDTAGAGWTYFTASGARTPFASLSSTGIIVPVRNQDYYFENMRTRASGNLKLEWRPSDQALFSIFGGYYHDKDVETRYEALSVPTGTPTSLTATSGQFAQGDFQEGLTYQPVTRNTYLIDTKGHYAFDSGIVIDGTLARSMATYRENRQMIKYDSNPRAGSATAQNLPAFGYSYQIMNAAPVLTLNNVAVSNDPASYKALYYRNIYRDLDSTVDYGKLNIGFNAAADDHGFGANIGGAITRTDLTYDQRYTEYVPASTAAQTAIGGLGSIIYADRPATYQTPATPYFLVNREAAWALFNANSSQFIQTNQIANNYADDFHDLEVTKAAYGQLVFHGDKFTAQAGVRYDRTDLTIDTNQAPTVTGTTAYTPQRRITDYAFVLPSALATYQLTGEMRVRAGVSKTIGRPDYSQYAARTSYSVGTDGSLTINTGNPGLKPREAWNYDLSYEWFLGGGGLFSVAGFVKDIRNEIFTSTQQGPTTVFNDVTYSAVTLSTPLNSAKARVKGLEFSFSQDHLPLVPGLGFNANFTLLKGSFDQPTSKAGVAAGGPAIRRTSGLIQQPDFIANVTLFYTRGPIDVRASYNRIGRALQSTDADTSTRDLYQESRQQLDLQARYTIMPGLDVVGQVQNLTKAPFVVRQGANRELLNYYFPVGRSLWLGLSWKPQL